MDGNFLNIYIISYRDTATFQFVPQVAQVAYYTNLFAALLISTIYDLKEQGLQINDDTNMFEIISNNPFFFLPLVPLVGQVAQIEKWLYLVRK